MTFFFVDMKSPGIEVKPIKQITGGSSFNEVYFTDVVIPDSVKDLVKLVTDGKLQSQLL